MDLRISAEELSSRIADWNEAKTVLYRALAGALERLIRDGRLPPDAQLPAERALATQLNVSRGTVMAAYELLRDGGLVSTVHGSGTVILPDASPVTGPREAHLTTALPHSSLLTGGGNAPDTDHIDLRSASWVGADAIESISPDRLQRRLLAAAETGRQDHQGSGSLRRSVASHLNRQSLDTDADQILITTGAQQAISLTLQLYVDPEEPVIVEDPTYPGAVEAAVARQARVHRIPVGPAGVELPTLRAAVERLEPRLIYLVPSVHNPTGAVMPSPVRHRLAEMVAEWDTVILDDTTLADTQFDGPMPSPLASYAEEEVQSRFVTVGSLSKSVWDGLRLGWVRATSTTVERLARLKGIADLGTSRVAQALAEELFGATDTLFAERRTALRHRRDLMSDLLQQHVPDWTWEPPSGGLCLWVDTGRPDVDQFCATAEDHGVSVIPAAISSASTRFPSYLRLPYAHPPEILEEAVRRLAAAWREHCDVSAGSTTVRPRERKLEVS